MKRLILFILLFLNIGFSEVYYVTKQGDNDSLGTSKATAWLTITKAIGEVAAGDTVYIFKGLYEENLTVATSGTGGAPIVWIAYEDSVILRSAGGANFTLYFNNKNYNRFYGFYFMGAESNNGSIYMGDNVSGNWIVNCYIVIPDNARASNIFIETNGLTSCVIRGNVFYGDPHGTNGVLRMNGGWISNIVDYNTFSLTKESQVATTVKVLNIDCVTASNNIIRNNILYAHSSSLTSGSFFGVGFTAAGDTTAWNSGNNTFDYNIVYGFGTNFYSSNFLAASGGGANVSTSDPLMVTGNRSLSNYATTDYSPTFKLWGYVKTNSPAIGNSSDGREIGAEPYVTIIGY